MPQHVFIQRSCLLLISSLLFISVGAQQQLVVYSVKGNVSIITAVKTEKAVAGQVLPSHAGIQLTDSAGITLICPEGTLFSLSAPGIYSEKDLQQTCPAHSRKKNKGIGTAISNYGKYLWSHAIKSHPNPGLYRKSYLNTVGAITGPNADIWVNRLLDTVNYSGLDGDFRLPWKTISEFVQTRFTLYTSNDPEKPVFDTIVKGLNIPISVFQSRMEPGRSYLWSLRSGSDDDNWSLKLLNYIDAATYKAVRSSILDQKPAIENEAQEAFRTAFQLEFAHYMAEAYFYYQKAVALAPLNSFYQSTLTAFQKDFDIERSGK